MAFSVSRGTRGGKRITLLTLAAFCVLLPAYLLIAVFSPQWIDARHRAYRTFFDGIEVGMSREQVLASLDIHYPADGPRQRPKIMKDSREELGFFMNPEDSHEPNCEGIFLDLSEGKVERKRYSRD